MESQQHKLIINIKKFFLSFNNNNYLPYKNSIFHLASTSEGIGRYLLNVLSKKKDQNFFKNFSIIFNIFNDVVYSLNYVNHKLYYSNTNFYYDKIVVTWAFENDFDKNGSFDDRYFNVNSKKLNLSDCQYCLEFHLKVNSIPNLNMLIYLNCKYNSGSLQ